MALKTTENFREIPPVIDRVKALDEIRILFVCLGNICRSPAAQGIMQHLVDEAGLTHRYILDSAGLYGGHAGELPDRRMRECAYQHGYRLDHRSRKVRSTDFENFDLVVAMDDSNYEGLRRLAPTVEDESKVVRMISFCSSHDEYFAVPDPYYEGIEGFRIVIDLLEDACSGLLSQLER